MVITGIINKGHIQANKIMILRPVTRPVGKGLASDR